MYKAVQKGPKKPQILPLLDTPTHGNNIMHAPHPERMHMLAMDHCIIMSILL